jgi:hypothetical protein
MEKGQKIIIISAISIAIVTVIIIASLSPGAYEEQCKQKAIVVLNNLYTIGGGKDAFLKLFSQGTLNKDEQNELQYFKKIINQCPNLQVSSEDKIGINISIFGTK